MSDWRAVPGYEGIYEVSSAGEVRSLTRRSRNQWNEFTITGKTLSPGINSQGRPAVVLSRDGKGKTWLVHRLVAMAFLGPCPPGYVVCHNNGDRTDNRAENLRWDSRSANAIDSIKHGTHFSVRITHCPQGHEYTESNTRLVRGGTARTCVTCRTEQSRRYEKNRRRRV